MTKPKLSIRQKMKLAAIKAMNISLAATETKEGTIYHAGDYITVNEMVWSDEQMTIPCPDGTYNNINDETAYVVIGGIVTEVIEIKNETMKNTKMDVVSDAEEATTLIDTQEVVVELAQEVEELSQEIAEIKSELQEFQKFMTEFKSAKSTSVEMSANEKSKNIELKEVSGNSVHSQYKNAIRKFNLKK